MFQKTIAFTVRSLRQDNRLLSVALLRLGMISFTLFFVYILSFEGQRLLAPGKQLLELLTVVNLLTIGVLGVGYFTSVITEEKEERTIGLLLMTGVSPISILLGKSIPRQINALILLSIQFPFTFLAITLGGVTIDQVISVYIFLFVTLLAVANLGLLASVLARTSFIATVISGLVITFFTLGPVFPEIIKEILRELSIQRPSFLNEWEDFMMAINPVYYFENLYRTNAILPYFGFYFYFYFVLSFLFFISARILFPYFVKSDQPEKGAPITHRLANIFRKKKRFHLNRESRRVIGNAFIWKDFHFQAGGKKWWRMKTRFYLAVTVPFIILFYYFNYPFLTLRSYRDFYTVLVIVMSLLIFAVVTESIYHVSNIFSQEIKSHGLSLLYMVPGSHRKKNYFKALGNLKGLVPAVGLLGAILLSMFLFESLFPEPRSGNFYYSYGLFSNFERDLKDVLDDSEFWAGVSLVIFAIHFLVTMTLFLKNAAIPVATVVVIFIIPTIVELIVMVIRPVSFSSSGYRNTYDTAFFLTAFILFAASAVMHFTIIPRRLKKLIESG
jgi:ABC-type transport system involved in multi-copper enzyme maturation permease subunit